MTILTRVIILLLLQTTALAAMVGKKQYTLNTGTQVLLQTEPIDPRSLFRGDYVILNFAISEIDLNKVAGDDSFESEDEIFVVLEPAEKYWEPVSAHRSLQAVTAPRVVIRGEVQYVQDWDNLQGERIPGNIVHIRYGIENYFVPEGEGRDLELRGGNSRIIDIRVAVDANGSSGIKAVLVDGVENHVESLF